MPKNVLFSMYKNSMKNYSDSVTTVEDTHH